MANWLEEAISQYYKLKGYITITNITYPTGKGRISDIDVLAINANSVVHIECSTWWEPTPKNVEKENIRLLNKFSCAEKYIFSQYPFLEKLTGKKITEKILITSGSKEKSHWGEALLPNLQTFCERNNIKLIEIKDFIDELINILKSKKKEKIGREESHSIRMLIQLIKQEII